MILCDFKWSYWFPKYHTLCNAHLANSSFEIEPFFNACKQGLIDLLEKKYLYDDEKRPNVIEVLKVADTISDEKLFNVAINYVGLMGKKSGKKAESELEEFMKSSEWEKFTKENPEHSDKVLNLSKPEK